MEKMVEKFVEKALKEECQVIKSDAFPVERAGILDSKFQFVVETVSGKKYLIETYITDLMRAGQMTGKIYKV